MPDRITIYLSPGRYTIFDPKGRCNAHYHWECATTLSQWLRADVKRLELRGFEVAIEHCEVQAYG
jgi:hypothetical protein